MVSAILFIVDAANVTSALHCGLPEDSTGKIIVSRGFLSGLTGNERTVWIGQGENWPGVLNLESDCPDTNLAAVLTNS